MTGGVLGQAFVYLSAAVITVPLFKRYGLGALLGYLVAGLAIGPSALGLIQSVEDVLHFAEFGVVLFLFMIGLELEPKKLWTLRVSIFGLGTAQVVINTAIITAIAMSFGLSLSTSLVIGMGLSLSSTAMALQMMRERNWLGTEGGKSALSILLFQDMAVIPMIAILPLLAPADAAGPAAEPSSVWLELIKTVGVFVVVILAGRFATRPVLRRLAGLGLREIFTAFALLLVVGMSVLMQRLDLSMGLGAFLAGVLLADSEYRHALEVDIEPFKNLFLGLFFISVGMSIDLSLVFQKLNLLLAVVCGLLALKVIIHAFLGLAFKLNQRQVPDFSIYIAQAGEFGFVLFGAASGLGIFENELKSFLLASVAASLFLSPVALYVYERAIWPRLNRWLFSEGTASGLTADEIESDGSPVIIVGFGRFGQIVGRLLYANGISATVLDHAPDQIELLRRFGFKVYFGDATREDLLESAGIAQAKLLVVSISDPAESLKLIDHVQAHYPHVKIFACARNVQHVYDLMDRKIAGFERAMFESSLKLGRDVLGALGWHRHDAWKAANRFRDHNNQLIKELHAIRHDQKRLVQQAKQAREDLTQMFDREREHIQAQRNSWDAGLNDVGTSH